MSLEEVMVRAEAVRVPSYRESPGDLQALSDSIRESGVRRAVTLWKDGTLVSGGRRLAAHFMAGRDRIPAVFVDTVEDAAKRLLDDNMDDFLARPMKWSEIARLWALLRILDEPAAIQRADRNRRKGVELRRKTMTGDRKPGRAHGRSDDYVLGVICEPFGVSLATARRIWTVYSTAYMFESVPEEKRKLAREVLHDIDETGNVWGNYQRLMGARAAPPARPRAVAPVEPAPAARQRSAWDKSLPQMEGLVAGLVELGPPNPELTWEQVGPVHARLMAVRRDMEKIIKQMKEISRS